MTTMRAKFKVTKVETFENIVSERLHLSVVMPDKYDSEGNSEDCTFARYSPAGEISLTISNPNLKGKFSVGQKFYVDFTEATE